MIRFGIGIGIAGTLPSVEEIGQWARQAEKEGAESIWCTEDYYYREGFSQMTYLASVTKETKIGLGVTNPYTRNAALLAMSIATVDQISRGRAILGMGCSLRLWIEEQMGIPFRSPLKTVKEYVKAIRRIVSGETVSYRGRFVNIKDVKLAFEPYRRTIPIFIAAVGPNMLRMAGSIGDGVLLTTGCSPKYIMNAVQHIGEGTKTVGKTSIPEIAEYMLFSVSSDPESARQAVRSSTAMSYMAPEFGERLLEGSGIDSATILPVREAFLKRDFEAASKLVTDEIIEKCTISGNHDQCVEKLKKHLRAGVTLPIICPVNGQIQEVFEVLTSL